MQFELHVQSPGDNFVHALDLEGRSRRDCCKPAEQR